MNKQAEKAKHADDDLTTELIQLGSKIARLAVDGEPFMTPVPGLSLHRYDSSSSPHSATYEPSLCLAVQGAKRVRLGDESFVYNESNYLITSLHLPTTVEILVESKEKPYLGLVLRFDQREMAQLMVDSHLPAPRLQKSSRSMFTNRISTDLLSAFQRMVDLLDHPEDIPILAPLIHREIIYRLLTGEQGVRLRQLASAGSQSHQIAQAIDWLRNNFPEPLRIDDLASRVHMSASTFHQHFRSMTGLSPLQYQKQLRLHEARMLMLAEKLDAATAAFKVGYESPSQFSREYKRMFGAPPSRDIKELDQTSFG